MAISTVGYAQNTTRESLFTINDKPYYTDEFARVYKEEFRFS